MSFKLTPQQLTILRFLVSPWSAGVTANQTSLNERTVEAEIAVLRKAGLVTVVGSARPSRYQTTEAAKNKYLAQVTESVAPSQKMSANEQRKMDKRAVSAKRESQRQSVVDALEECPGTYWHARELADHVMLDLHVTKGILYKLAEEGVAANVLAKDNSGLFWCSTLPSGVADPTGELLPEQDIECMVQPQTLPPPPPASVTPAAQRTKVLFKRPAQVSPAVVASTAPQIVSLPKEATLPVQAAPTITRPVTLEMMTDDVQVMLQLRKQAGKAVRFSNTEELQTYEGIPYRKKVLAETVRRLTLSGFLKLQSGAFVIA